jgi:hypothetical protein
MFNPRMRKIQRLVYVVVHLASTTSSPSARFRDQLAAAAETWRAGRLKSVAQGSSDEDVRSKFNAIVDGKE